MGHSRMKIHKYKDLNAIYFWFTALQVHVNSLQCNYFPKHSKIQRLPSLLRDKSMTYKKDF